MNETRYPLCWPVNWKRTANRTRAQFGKTSKVTTAGGSYSSKSRLNVSDSIQRIAYELERFGVPEDEVIVSTNVRLNLSGIPHGGAGEPIDPGVAIYWKLKGKSQCMAIDRYDRVADNLAAIAATLEAMRAIERHGGGSILERAFIGFAQLPAAIVTQRPWREVFGYGSSQFISPERIDASFKELATRLHPDKEGGSHDAMAELNAARAAALAELSR